MWTNVPLNFVCKCNKEKSGRIYNKLNTVFTLGEVYGILRVAGERFTFYSFYFLLVDSFPSTMMCASYTRIKT